MDMKKILQAMDGISTKPVEGADSMAKFLRVVKEAEINQVEAVGDFGADPKKQAEMYLQFHTGMMDPSTLPAFMTVAPGISLAVQPPTNPTGSHEEVLASLSAANKRLPKDLQVSWDELKDIGGVSDTIKLTGEPHPDTYNPTTDPVQENSLSKFLSIVGKNDVSILSEGASPHKVALPVQMAMQHYQQAKEQPQPRERLIDKYFVEAESEITQRREEKRALINQYAKTIAERVLMKESAQPVSETPIEMTGDANDPHIYGHEKANPMSLKGRIMSARAQLKELAQLSESDDLLVWERITQLHKGGMFMGLEQNLEQIRHGISELAAKRRKGGVQSRGINPHIGEGKRK